MTAKSFKAWNPIGRTIDLDNQSYDCVDVPKSWLEYLTGQGWQKSAGWGNAKDIWANWSTEYVDRIPRGNQPKTGDIVCMDGSIGQGYGHTGVVESVDGGNMTILQQNTFTQQPVYRGTFGWSASYIQGFLRPWTAFSIDDAVALQGYQRITRDAVNYRKEASRTGEKIELFPAGETYDFKAWVRGENVDGNDVWFVGRYTNGYAWSGAFTDAGTHDLEDMTPKANPLAGNQRQIGSDAMNIRKDPRVAPENVIRLVGPAAIVTFDGYTKGQSVDGVDVWFRLADNGGFMWSGGLTDQTTHDLSDVTPVVPEPTKPAAPTTPTTPTTPATDSRIAVVVNKQHPNDPLMYFPSDLALVGNGQYLRKEAADALARAVLDAKAAGVTLQPASGYRAYMTQQTVYNGYVAKDGQSKADTYSARPGFSEHQTGLAMDFGAIDDSFAGTPAFPWLQANGYKYGFVLRYPNGQDATTGYNYEPWHWRYIGVSEATRMHESGAATLEQFYNVTGGLYADQDTQPTPAPDGTTPKPTDPTEIPPTTTPTATSSSAKFVARIAAQVVTARLAVEGIAGLVTTQTGTTFSQQAIGWGTIIAALAIIAYSQFAYKKDFTIKWPF